VEHLWHLEVAMSRRSEILQEYTATLAGANYLDNAIAHVYRGFRWLDQINDFPTICYSVQSSTLDHIGANDRYYALDITLRVYVRGEDSQALIDQMLLDVERTTENFRDVSSPSLEVVDARVNSVSSDEGLMSPNGVGDMSITISYKQSSIV
jgi:hypothetical protein